MNKGRKLSYCIGCGASHPEDGLCGRVKPKRTVAEQLDDASDGKEFGDVISRMFKALERER